MPRRPSQVVVTDDDRQIDWIRNLSDQARLIEKDQPLLLGLLMYTVYYNPSDHPGKYVVRAIEVTSTGTYSHENCVVAESLDEVRKSIPCDLLRLNRDDNDDACIVEVWI